MTTSDASDAQLILCRTIHDAVRAEAFYVTAAFWRGQRPVVATSADEVHTASYQPRAAFSAAHPTKEVDRREAWHVDLEENLTPVHEIYGYGLLRKP